MTDNGSVSSMDSFIRDMPSFDEDAGNHPQGAEDRPSRDYFSPSSVDSGTHVNSNKDTWQDQARPSSPHLLDMAGHGYSPATPARRDTIAPQQTPAPATNSRRKGSFVSVGSEGKPVKPATPFFSPSFYEDSDMSESSIVFKSTEKQVSPRHPVSRDRFPSFDSMGSSGSIVRKPKARPPPSAPTNPKILPYHERRKLQQNTPSSSQQKSYNPPSPVMYHSPEFGFYPQFPPPGMHPNYNFPTMQYPGMPMPPPPSHAQQFAPPYPVHQQVPIMGQPMPMYPGPLPPPPQYSHQGFIPQQNAYGSSIDPRNARYNAPGPPNTSTIQAQVPRVANKEDLQQPMRQQSDPEASTVPPRPERRKDGAPPPPPLPMPHVRQASNDESVSSLGSVEAGKDESKRKVGFLQRLNPWSAKEPNVKDYHKRNQEFLKKSTKKREQQQQMLAASLSPMSQKKRVPLTSMDRPPPSRGTHKRLPSIENDSWEEPKHEIPDQTASSEKSKQPKNEDDSSYISSDDSTAGEPTEKTRLLKPTPAGIPSNEGGDKPSSSGLNRLKESVTDNARDTFRSTNLSSGRHSKKDDGQTKTSKRYKEKKSRSTRSRRSYRNPGEEYDDDSISSSSVSAKDMRHWMRSRDKLLEKERTKLIKQWREEARLEEEAARRKKREEQWDRRLYQNITAALGDYMKRSFKYFAWAELFIANMPLLIGAIALAVADLGVVWFKFAEENLDSCQPVHFHSSQCTFPEFPGCFYCDTNARMYKLALDFHRACSTAGAVLASFFFMKLLIASRVVFDELGSPTTATPAGLICQTLDVVFAGKGVIGQAIVTFSATTHLCIAIWFIYMALAYHIMPEPSWFPNSVSIGISAVKIWLYYPMAGHFLMAISLSLNFFFFPISLIRVALNKKISATVGWMQMSAPSVSLYALTLMAQPSFEEEHPDINRFQKMHRLVYLPCMHFLFGLCVIGMLASVTSLMVRWSSFRKFPFSPAHAAFCVPTLCHANALQAYRAALNSFSEIPANHPFLIFVYVYWVTFLVGGTITTLIISTKFILSLPKWTHIDFSGEIEPPAPYETSMTASNLIAAGETLVQPFISPAILQANETGALVLSRNSEGYQVYRRTRQVTALGFEPILSDMQLVDEREVLLDWVGKNPPRRRHRTLSVPGIDFNYGAGLGTGNAGVYGTMEEGGGARNRGRANTHSPYMSGTNF